MDGKKKAVMKFFQDVIEQCSDVAFLKQVSKKYHFEEAMLADLEGVAVLVKKAISEMASFDYRILTDEKDRRMAEVAMTLGEDLDHLQDAFGSQGLLMESYMVEALGNEILLQAYSAWNQYVTEKHGIFVERYIFFGGDDSTAVEDMRHVLSGLQIPVICNEAYCLIPSKSVVFSARLSEKETKCLGICTGCNNRNCPNRMEAHKQGIPQLQELLKGPLPYGYARIFGK